MIIVEQIWTANRARNFNYLVACSETGEAAAIDPVDSQRCLSVAAQRDWRITQIINTHGHADHIAGNEKMIQATSANLLAPASASSSIKNINRGLAQDDIVKIGASVQLKVLDTPGHTMSHVALLSNSQTPILFSGDTLFNAGVGNCRNGGDPQVLFETTETKIQTLADDTRVYPGHEYLLNNLAFSLDREPDNQNVKDLLENLGNKYDPNEPLVTTIGLEREINPFLRLQSESLVQRLLESFPNMSQTRLDIFLRLREIRDRW